MNEIRRAALSLHGLDDEDRAWVLSRLAEDQRTELEALVRELDELGFPRQAGAMHGQSVATPPASPEPAPARAMLEDRFDEASPERVLAGLADASPAVIAWLLRRRQWRWARKVRRRLGRERRRAVEARLEQPAPAVTERVQNELVELFGRALGVGADAGSGRPGAGRPGAGGT
jgi:hypothetical protein